MRMPCSSLVKWWFPIDFAVILKCCNLSLVFKIIVFYVIDLNNMTNLWLKDRFPAFIKVVSLWIPDCFA